MVIVVFSFWTYIAVKGIIDVREEKQNLLLQKKIEGNVSILKKKLLLMKAMNRIRFLMK